MSTRAPYDLLTATVSSVLPESSTTMSLHQLSASRHVGRFSASLNVKMSTETFMSVAHPVLVLLREPATDGASWIAGHDRVRGHVLHDNCARPRWRNHPL